jgi:anti-sigma-K factor RskA
MSTDQISGEGKDGDHLLVGEFALGLLDAEERERLARRIAAEPALKAELRMWHTRLAALDTDFVEEAPPRVILARLEARLFPVARAPGIWNSLAVWRSLAAGGFAVAAIAIGLNIMQPQQIDPQQFAVQLVAALQSQEGSGVEFVALYDAATGSVRLTSLSGEVAPDRDLELWYIKGDDPAVSMGVIPVGQRTEIALDEATKAKFAEGTVLALTLEQKGGSPTGVAQGPIVAVGAATEI